MRAKFSAPRLGALIGTIIAASLTSDATSIIFAERFLEIDGLAREAGADLIPMSTHGPPGLDSLYAGGVAKQLIRRLCVLLLLIHPTEEWRSRSTQFKKLLVGLDGSEAAERALRYARALARSFGGEILLLSAPEADSEQARLRDYLENVAPALQERGYQARPLVTGPACRAPFWKPAQSRKGT